MRWSAALPIEVRHGFGGTGSLCRGIHIPHKKRLFPQCDGYQATEPNTLYTSSFMSCYMNATKLRTQQQKADVLFYPGADAMPVK